MQHNSKAAYVQVPGSAEDAGPGIKGVKGDPAKSGMPSFSWPTSVSAFEPCCASRAVFLFFMPAATVGTACCLSSAASWSSHQLGEPASGLVNQLARGGQFGDEGVVG
jgi:hypothetical protein